MALPSVMKNKSKGVKSGMKVSGGKGHMINGQASNTQKPGVSSQEQSRIKGGKPHGGSGPNNKMFGYSGSKPKKPA